MNNRYPIEVLGVDDDNGTMPENVEKLSNSIIGRRIASVENVPSNRYNYDETTTTIITLDNGTRVKMVGVSDCCAYSEVNAFLLHPESVDHAIMGVGTTGSYTKWHIFADYGDILQLTVEWSPGNQFYYAYGFNLTVEEIPEDEGKSSPHIPTRREPANQPTDVPWVRLW